MKRTLAIIASLVFFGQAALAANVFVRNTEAGNLQRDQANEVTQAVKRAVSNMPEHKLVQSEDEADFVLQPSVVRRGDEQVLRIEKMKDGNLLAMSEETISSVNNSQDGAFGVTETAMNEDRYVSQDDSMSASSSSGGNNVSGKSGASPEESKQSLSDSSGSMSGPRSMDRSTASTGESSDQMGTTGSAMAAGESRGPSPRFANPNRIGYFNIGAGPAFGVGLKTDNVMYDINGGYNIDVTERLTAKGFVDLNLSTGSDDARLINLGVGANVYMTQANIAGGRPYLAGDIGYGFARNNESATKDAITAGAGAGFQFSAAQLNMDVSLHYSILTAQINEDNPQVLGLRLAVNF